jgi:hypothetical protein
MRTFRNFWNQNRKDMLIGGLAALRALFIAKYKVAWLAL